MDILIVTLFVSLLLVVAGLVLFVLRLGAGDFEHADRLSLLPLLEPDPLEQEPPDQDPLDQDPLDHDEPQKPIDSFVEQVRKADCHGS